MIGKFSMAKFWLVSEVTQANEIGVAPSAGILHG